MQTSTSQSNKGSTRNDNNKWAINLSKASLTPAQESLLAKGPNFAITPRVPPNVDYISAIESISQKLTEQDVQELKADINSLLKRFLAPKANLTKEQRKALGELKKRSGQNGVNSGQRGSLSSHRQRRSTYKKLTVF